MIIIYGLVALFILWVFFVNVMWLKSNREKIPTWLVKPLMAFVFLGILYDVLFNITFGTIMFMGLPDFKGANFQWKGIGFPTLSHRMRVILRAGKKDSFISKWRFYQARFYCRYLVEPWDKGHCGLKEYGVDDA